MHPPSFFSPQPYPSESFFFSFPSLPLDSPPPPGSDPQGNSTLYASAYGHQSVHSLDAAAKASLGTSAVSADFFPSACNDIWVDQLLPSLTPVMLPMPNKTKANEPMLYGVCKTDCNSKDVFGNHVCGEKNKRNMQFLNNPTNMIIPGASHASLQSQRSRVRGQDLFGAVSKELKKRDLVKGGAAVHSGRVCTICNIACNSQDVYNEHLSGKKHAAQISLMYGNGIGPYAAAFKRYGIGHWKKVPKKIKFTQPAWCELCKINCTSRDTYMTHLAGKKHLRNLELLSKSNNALQLATNPVIGPQGKPNTCKDEGIISHKPHIYAMVNDIEAKKRKLVEGGAAETDIRICTLCNVVCNSQTVFYFHLTGQKHAAMVKVKLNQEQAGSNYILPHVQNICNFLEGLSVS